MCFKCLGQVECYVIPCFIVKWKYLQDICTLNGATEEQGLFGLHAKLQLYQSCNSRFSWIPESPSSCSPVLYRFVRLRSKFGPLLFVILEILNAMDTKHWHFTFLSLLLQTVSCGPHSRKSSGRMNSSQAEKQSASEREKQEHQLQRRWSPQGHRRTESESTSSNTKCFPAACSFCACRSRRSRTCCWGMLWGCYGDAMGMLWIDP